MIKNKQKYKGAGRNRGQNNQSKSQKTNMQYAKKTEGTGKLENQTTAEVPNPRSFGTRPHRKNK